MPRSRGSSRSRDQILASCVAGRFYYLSHREVLEGQRSRLHADLPSMLGMWDSYLPAGWAGLPRDDNRPRSVWVGSRWERHPELLWPQICPLTWGRQPHPHPLLSRTPLCISTFSPGFLPPSQCPAVPLGRVVVLKIFVVVSRAVGYILVITPLPFRYKTGFYFLSYLRCGENVSPVLTNEVFFEIFFFNVGHILKSYWICYSIASALCFGFLGPQAYAILVPWIRDETHTPCIGR